MFNEVLELLAQVSDGIWRAIVCAVFQAVEHWHRRNDECKRNAYMTERQQINHMTASTLMNLLKAEMEGLGFACTFDPDFRPSSTQWQPIGKLNCAPKDIVENDVCCQSTKFTRG